MLLPQPMAKGVLVSRYKRFFADVALDAGGAVTAHCPNPGAMLGLGTPGLPVWVSRSDDPKRKLAHTLELVEVGEALVGINAMAPNRLVAEALMAGVIPELAGYETFRREVRYGEKSRVDFRLEAPDRPDCYLEVKNCHLMREAGLAEFPDCVTTRGLRHLGDLAREVEAGNRAVMLFVVQRNDCDRFAAAADLDPAYAEGLLDAAARGVEVLCYGCDITPESVRIVAPMPWREANARTLKRA